MQDSAGYKTIDYKNIPVNADIVSGIAGVRVDANNCLRELERYISADQGIASTVLRVANSALYNRGKQISSIPIAISVLGFNVIRALAMLAFSRSLFTGTRSNLILVHIWQHSLLTAIASQQICRTIGDGVQADEAFIAGLIHDVGKVLLFTHDRALYLTVLNLVLEHGYSSAETERQHFGFDHCQVGREAVGQWKLPEKFADYMGTDFTIPHAEYVNLPVEQSLAAANCLIDGSGIGAQAMAEHDARKSMLLQFGLKEDLCDVWLQEDFVPSLMQHETYQLCANL